MLLNMKYPKFAVCVCVCAGGYYLTSAYGAMSLLRHFREDQAAEVLSSQTRNTLHQWHRRRTDTLRASPSINDFQVESTRGSSDIHLGLQKTEKNSPQQGPTFSLWSVHRTTCGWRCRSWTAAARRKP